MSKKADEVAKTLTEFKIGDIVRYNGADISDYMDRWNHYVGIPRGYFDGFLAGVLCRVTGVGNTLDDEDSVRIEYWYPNREHWWVPVGHLELVED